MIWTILARRAKWKESREQREDGRDGDEAECGDECNEWNEERDVSSCNARSTWVKPARRTNERKKKKK